MTGCMQNSLLLGPFDSLEYFRKILSKEKERKEHDKKTKYLTEGKHRNRGVICHCTGFKCYAHYGGIPSGNILHCVGSHLPAVYRRRIFFHSKNIKTEQKNTDPSGNVRSLCVCDFFLEDPVCDRKLFPYDRNRTGCDLIRADGSRRVGADRVIISGNLLAHGGLTTLGANTFSMAIAGPFLSYGIYKLCQKLNVNRKVAVFLAAFFGDLFTYCVTSLQLAMAYPSEAGGVGASAVKFLGVFAPTQLPLAVMEGLLTVVIVIALESYAKPELKAVGFLKEEK